MRPSLTIMCRTWNIAITPWTSRWSPLHPRRWRICSNCAPMFALKSLSRSGLHFKYTFFFVLFYALIICNHNVDYKNNKYRVVIVLLNCFVIRSLAYFVNFLLKLLFRWLDPSRPGRCPRASQHILPRRSVHFALKYFSIFQFSGKIPVNSLFL